MNQPPTPDSPFERLIEALRSAPNENELSGEATAIEAMASAIADASIGDTAMASAVPPSPLKKPTLTRRARRVVVLTTVGVLGVAGVAAAGKGAFIPDNRPVLEATLDTDDADETVPETSIVDTTASETTMVDTTPADGDDDEGDDESKDEAEGTADSGPTTSIECADGNHGKTVSSVAHETPPGPGHGEAVSAAAQSDCGKKDATDDTSVDTSLPSDTTAPDATTAADTSNGNGHGNGHGKPDDPGSQGNRPTNPGNPGNGNGG